MNDAKNVCATDKVNGLAFGMIEMIWKMLCDAMPQVIHIDVMIKICSEREKALKELFCFAFLWRVYLSLFIKWMTRNNTHLASNVHWWLPFQPICHSAILLRYFTLLWNGKYMMISIGRVNDKFQEEMNLLNDTERKIKMNSCRSLKRAKEGKRKAKKEARILWPEICLLGKGFVRSKERRKKVCIHCKTDVTLPSKAIQRNEKG